MPSPIRRPRARSTCRCPAKRCASRHRATGSKRRRRSSRSSAPQSGRRYRQAASLAGRRALAACHRPARAGDENTFDAFAKWAEDWGIAVCSWWATHLAISTEHPCHVGADPGPGCAKADVVVVLNSLSPWWPDKHKLADDAKVINIGPDPVFSRFPVRNFRSDLTIAGETALTIPALIEAMDKLVRDEKALKPAANGWPVHLPKIRDLLASQAKADTARGITKSYVSHCLGEALDGLKASVFSELGTIARYAEARPSTSPGSRNRIPAASAGASRRPSAPSLPSRTASVSPQWATAHTCSPIRRFATRSPKRSTCRFW
jgi:thiamine pyrophosphate-dependent acetolactate synthase large subunit-like protein